MEFLNELWLWLQIKIGTILCDSLLLLNRDTAYNVENHVTKNG